MLSHYFTFAVRNLGRHRLHTFINILGLGLGLMCFVGAYLFVDYSRSFESQFRNADRIYTIYRGVRFSGVDYPPFPYVSIYLKDYVDANFPDVEAMARSQAPFEGVVSVAGEESYRRIKKADPEFFEIFDLPLLSGDLDDPLRQPGNAVITADAAEALYGTRDVIGRSLTAENRDLTIAAVMDRITGPSHLGTSFLEGADGAFDIMVRYDWNLDESATTPSPGQVEFWLRQSGLTHVLLPRDGSLTPANFTARLQALVDNNLPDDVATVTYDTRHVSELPMWIADQNVFGGRIGLSVTTSLLLLGAMVLTMACLNFVNLATAQAAVRAKEVAMRKVLGAGRIQVALQYLAESLITVTIALLLALMLLRLAVPTVNLHLHSAISSSWLGELRLWVFFASVVVIVGVLAGLYPALILAGARPVRALSGNALRSGPTSLRTLLVGAQFVLASFLMIVVFAMYQQNRSLRHTGVELARDPLVVITADIGDAGIDLESLGTELAGHPSVTGFTGSGIRPWTSASGGLEFGRSPEETGEKIHLSNNFISFDYFSTMGIQLLAGRDFSRNYASDEREFDSEKNELVPQAEVNSVIDRAAAEGFGWRRPEMAVGQVVYHRLPEQPVQATRIIGVVESSPYHLVNWGTPPDGTAYFTNGKLASIPIVRLSRTDVAGGVEVLDDAWDRLSPDYPIQRRFLDEDFDRAMQLFENINTMFVGLAAFAILIATMGLYSMATYLSNRRKKEIGIRKSIGASTESILRLIVWDFLKPVVLASLIAWPLAFIALRAYLAMFVNRIPLTPIPFLVSFFVTILIAAVAISTQVLMTARVSPAQVLRVD